MAELRDLIVEEVSLVDRAAVRDPDDPDEPMRFLIWKRDWSAAERRAEQQQVSPLVREAELAWRVDTCLQTFGPDHPRTRAAMVELRKAQEEQRVRELERTAALYDSIVTAIEQRARALMRQQPDLTYAASLERVLRAEPELYRQYDAARRARQELARLGRA